MRSFLPLLGVMFLVACSSSSESATGEDDIRRASIDPKMKKLAETANCAAGNSVHALERFTPSRFDAAKELDAIKQADRERGCPGRDYSASKIDGANMFKNFLTEEAELFADQCSSSDETVDAAALRTQLSEVASDPANLGVYSSIHDRNRNDDPVHCAFFRFHVYRADGTLVKFDFDWSD